MIVHPQPLTLSLPKGKVMLFIKLSYGQCWLDHTQSRNKNKYKETVSLNHTEQQRHKAIDASILVNQQQVIIANNQY